MSLGHGMPECKNMVCITRFCHHEAEALTYVLVRPIFYADVKIVPEVAYDVEKAILEAPTNDPGRQGQGRDGVAQDKRGHRTREGRSRTTVGFILRVLERGKREKLNAPTSSL